MAVESGSHGTIPMAELERIHEAGKDHLERLSGNSSGLGKVLSAEADLTHWFKALAARPEIEQYRSAHRDLGLAVYAISTGMYRQAFAGLRSFVEVFLGNLKLSSAEFERRQWINGRRDLSWSEITDLENGLFSRRYIREFQPIAEAEGAKNRDRAMAAYRRCSEYLHGNVQTTNLLPSKITYTPEVIEQWIEAASDSLSAIHHGLFVRYFNELDGDQQHEVEPVLEERLVTYRSVRQCLGLPLEGES